MREHSLSCKSIPAHTLLEEWLKWERAFRKTRHPINLLAEQFGCDQKLILAKVRKLIAQGLLDCGASEWSAWTTAEGAALLKEFLGA